RFGKRDGMQFGIVKFVIVMFGSVGILKSGSGMSSVGQPQTGFGLHVGESGCATGVVGVDVGWVGDGGGFGFAAVVASANAEVCSERIGDLAAAGVATATGLREASVPRPASVFAFARKALAGVLGICARGIIAAMRCPFRAGLFRWSIRY